MLNKFCLVFYLAMYFGTTSGQSTLFDVNWENIKQVRLPKEMKLYEKYDLIIIDDSTEFNFYESDVELAANLPTKIEAEKDKLITRILTIKIQNEKGLQALSNFKLPESFDPAFDLYFSKQGRASRIKTPYIDIYNLKKFSARKHSPHGWQPLRVSNKYESVRWIKRDGEFADDDITIMQIKDLQVGDVVQVYYEALFKKTYGSNLFYFYSSQYPKIHATYSFIYTIDKYMPKYMFVMPVNIEDSLIDKREVSDGKNITVEHKITLNHLMPVNYPYHSFEGGKLPHVYVDMDFLVVATKSIPNAEQRKVEYSRIKPKHFEWLFIKDTNYSYQRIYDKHFNELRRYVSTFPALNSDSNNVLFFKAFIDTLNGYRYITKNQLLYNESHLYNATTMEHVAKRRLVGSPHSLFKDVLNDNEIFYYLANIQDKRYGEHSQYYRVHYPYEWEIIALPNKNSYIYFMIRPNGVPFHLNELPFYLEGSTASLFPMNLQQNDSTKSKKFFKFIKTHKGTFNENTRTENASVKISLNEHKAEYAGKESLSGQFSTVLRHLYLNEIIDSTIAPYYFKRCTDKPLASDIKIKLSSKITDFPFRYTFNCSEKIALPYENKLSLNNWFSFLFSSKTLPEMPTHDYFFDFDFSDAYNFMLEFDRPVEIKNANDFFRNMNNTYFELSSEILKNSEASYLIKVKLILKQMAIPLSDMQLLMDLVKELDAVNSFSLEW